MTKSLPQLSSEAQVLRMARRKRAAKSTGRLDLAGAAIICVAAGAWEWRLAADLGPDAMVLAVAYLGLAAFLGGLLLAERFAAARPKLVHHG